MPKVTIYNPRGQLEAEGEVPKGRNLLEASQELGALHGSACGGVCSCSTCHVWVKQGLASLTAQSEEEQDILDKAFDVKPSSRLGCQAEVGTQDVYVEISEESLRAWYDENPKQRHERDEKLLAEGKTIPAPARDLRKR